MYAMGGTPYEMRDYTPHEIREKWYAYLWRRKEQENTLASLVTVWIANTAGKVLKKPLTVKDVFSDGRFKKEFTADDWKIFDEIKGGETNGK